MADTPVTLDQIRWHIPAFSYTAPDRPFTAKEMVQLAELQDILAGLDAADITAWMLDLLMERMRLEVALRAAMDGLHEAEANRKRTEEQYFNLRDRLMRTAVTDKPEVQK